MKRSMFSHLLTLFLCMSLVFVVALFSFLFINIRSERIAARLEEVRMQSEDLVYLSSTLQNESYYRLSSNSSKATKEHLYHKCEQVYENFEALTLIVSRDGTINAYYHDENLENQSLSMAPTMEKLNEYISRATQGEELTSNENTASGPVFTLIVPWTQTNSITQASTVMGIVMIRVPEQTIHVGYQGLLMKLIFAALGVFLLAAVLSYIAAMHMTRPLTAMASISDQFAKGVFSQRAQAKGSREIQQLADSFNHMADQLSTTEQSRKDFIANISHEFRSPITSIHGFAQGLLDGTIPQEERTKYLTVIVNETNRLSKLVNNLLNLSRMERQDIPLAITDFDINEMIRRTIISKIPQLEEKELELEPVFESESCYVRADLEQIQQVLINLLDNAIKYTPEHGSITITTESKENTVYLHVKDNGIGILESDARHIFDRFYKADKAHTVGKGTGLGLAICKIIMDRHNQSIRLVSGEHGSDFEITLEKGTQPESKNGKGTDN